MKKLLIVASLLSLAYPVAHAQSGGLGLYNCTAIQTYTQQQYPPVIVTGPMTAQICAENTSQANRAASSIFAPMSTPDWRITGQCNLASQVPFSLCTAPGQQL